MIFLSGFAGFAGFLMRHYCRWRGSCNIATSNIQRPGGARWVGEDLASLLFAAFLLGSKEEIRAQALFTPCGNEGELWADG